MSKLLGEIGRGYARGGVIMLGSTVIMLSLMCVLICFPLWLVQRMDAPQWVLFLSGGLLLVILFGSIPVVLIASYQVRKNKLDKVFLPLGMTGERYQFLFRRYYGQVDSKELSIRFYRGPVLEIETLANVEYDFVVSQTHSSGLSNFIGQSSLQFDLPSLENAKIFTRNENFVERLLKYPDLIRQLGELTIPHKDFIYRYIIGRSGKLILMSAFSSRLFGFNLDPDATRSWVVQMVSLTKAFDLIDIDNDKLSEGSVE